MPVTAQAERSPDCLKMAVLAQSLHIIESEDSTVILHGPLPQIKLTIDRLGNPNGSEGLCVIPNVSAQGYNWKFLN